MSDHLAQGKILRAVSDQRQQDDAKSRLHPGVFVEHVQDNFGVFVALEFDDDPHPVAVGFIAQVGDPFDLFVADQLGDFLNQSGFIDHERDFGNDNRFFPLRQLFAAGDRA